MALNSVAGQTDPAHSFATEATTTPEAGAPTTNTNFREDVCLRAICSDEANDEDGEQGEPFKPFSWLTPDAQNFPLSRFASSTRDLAQGLALTLEILEGTGETGVQLKGQPRFDANQLGILSRFAVATANAIASEACEAVEWLNEHGASHVRKGAFTFAGRRD